jgi:endonuclease/exonuclease/phosphatase family metal-dependent hydrolase
MFRLDAVAAHPAAALGRGWAHGTALARVASDHRPVCAELQPPPTLPL